MAKRLPRPVPLDRMDKKQLLTKVKELQAILSQTQHRNTVLQGRIMALEQGVHHSATPLADLCRQIDLWRKQP